MTSQEAISSFTGSFRYLSNFFYAPIKYNGLKFLSSEAAYQAAKCLDPKQRQEFSFLSAGEAKRKGRGVVMREDWEEVKLRAMKEIICEKFRTYPILAQSLKATAGYELIEGNTWGDTYWGVCDGEGENHLGKILMEIRQELLERGPINAKAS